jgi:hypothetical protein
MALVLGAGISGPFGLPDWLTLVDRLHVEAGVEPNSELGMEKQVEALYLGPFGKNKVTFHAAVKKALYQEIQSIDFWIMSKLLQAIGALVMASRRGNVAEVITFNFDDILEAYLEFHGFVTTSVISDKTYTRSADVTVIHPHGLLPYRDGIAGSSELVLEQSSFSRILGPEGALWRTNLLSVMRNKLCLFIGVGNGDHHLESLLFDCKGTHSALADPNKLPYWGVRFTKAPKPDEILIWRERGIATYSVGDFENDLPSLLVTICQKAARSRISS